MNKPMILKRGTVKRKLSSNQYELEEKDGAKLIMTVPKKFLMNYLGIETGDIAYILVNSEDEIEGKWAIKYDFMDDPNLLLQKEELDKKYTDESV
ncbi:hypothetical protein BKI52_19140 [marine bacterium AO1-C]|nr:hypothetical protein BKI52_19140 [marine bacterium AO1-C]